MPRPESFGVEEMLGNGNDNVPVKGDFRATTDPPLPRADPTASVIRRSAEWRSGASADGLGLSQDERDFLTELAAKRELVTDRARYAEYATAASTGQKPMPVARPATAPARERKPARPATAATRGPAKSFATKSAKKTPPRRETTATTAFADPRDAHGHALERDDEVARGSAIKPIKPTMNASPVSRRNALGSPGRDATTTTTTRRRELFAPSPQRDSGDDENVKPASTTTMHSRGGPGPGPGPRPRPENAEEATASWRDSLRGARLRRAAARGEKSAEDPAAFFFTADAAPDASRRAVLSDARPEPEPAREIKTQLKFLSSPKKSPKSPEVSLEHLSAVRLTADERAFLARLAKERALVTDRARHGAAAAAAAGADPRESPLRASLPDPIVAQPSPLVSPPAPPERGAGDAGAGAAKTRSAAGASPVRFARAAFGDDVAVAAARKKQSPARRYGGDSAAGGAVVAARWRPSPTREARAGASRERPSTAAARMSSEHAREMWRREPGDMDASDVSYDAAKASTAGAPDPNPGEGEGTTRDLATLEALVARESARSFEAPFFLLNESENRAPPSAAPASVSPARDSFERARPPARASVPGPDTLSKRIAWRPDVYSRGVGVSISGVLGNARVSRSVETSRTDPDPEWEWQGSWQREWQTSLESPETERERAGRSDTSTHDGEALTVEALSPTPKKATSTQPPAPAVSESTPKSLSQTIRETASLAADESSDSPAWTLSPSPLRGEGEGEYSAYSPRGASPLKRELVPPRGSPLRSPVSRSPLSMSGSAAPLAAEQIPRLGAGSYRERRDARKASRRGDEELLGGTARTGLDVRGVTSGGAVFY